MHVKGTVAIVTGGARGFGKAFSEALLKRGGKVGNRLLFIAGQGFIIALCQDKRSDFVFYVPFNSIKVIWRRWNGGNDRLCAMKRYTVMN